MTTDYSLQNAIALVTGANRGIGRALVENLLSRGAAKVYAAARDTSSLNDLVATHGSRVVPLALDVTQSDQITAVAQTASDATVVINNAGVVGNPDLFGETLAGARQEFEVNYWGPLQVIRSFTPAFRARGQGVFVNLSSVAGLSNFPMFATYSDSKAAAHSLTTGARQLLRGDGIRVIGVYPGPVDTDMAKSITMPKASPSDVANHILDGIENGAEEVFTDEMSRSYADAYEAGAKTLERRITTMLQPV